MTGWTAVLHDEVILEPSLPHRRGQVLQSEVRVGEGQVYPDWDRVESLEAEDQLVEEQLRLFVQRAHVGVALVEPQQGVHGPFQLGKPNVQAGHAKK